MWPMRRAIILVSAVLVVVAFAIFRKGYGFRVNREPCTYWNGIYKMAGENPPSDCPWFGRPYFIIR